MKTQTEVTPKPQRIFGLKKKIFFLSFSILFLVSAMIFLWYGRRTAQIQALTKTVLQGIETQISGEIKYQTFALKQMARNWEIREEGPQKNPGVDENDYRDSFSGYAALEWVDRPFAPRWIIPWDKNAGEPGFKLGADFIQNWVRESIESKREVYITPFFESGKDQKSFLILVPTFGKNKFGGSIVVIGVFEPGRFFDKLFKPEKENGFSFEIWENGKRIYSTGPISGKWVQEADFIIPFSSQSVWKIRVSLTPELVGRLRPSRAWLVLGVTLVLLLVGFVIYFSRTERFLEREREQIQEEKTQLTEKVEATREELARSNAELQQFVYAVSHDLQEPLRMIASYAQLLDKRYQDKLDKDGQDFIKYVSDGAVRAQQLIHDLLEYSRLGAQKKPFVLVPCDETFQQVLMDLKVVIAESRAEVKAGPLPMVRGDNVQIRQLFQNLIANALKFRSPDRPLKIRISAEKKENQWQFSVQDNGIGIDPQYWEKIFIIFQRLHLRTEYPGSGIGLALCQKIVENHGGRIWVESVPGQGSAFYFTLPPVS